MHKVIIYIIIVVILIGWLGNFELSLKPFRIALPNWRAALGIIIICIGAGIYYDAGRRKGWNAAIDKVIEVIDNQKKRSNDPPLPRPRRHTHSRQIKGEEPDEVYREGQPDRRETNLLEFESK